MRLAKWLIRTVYWLEVFIGCVIFFGLLSWGLASAGVKYYTPALILGGAGILTGIILAEYIRRKIGLETFFGRIYGPNEMDKN